MVPPGESPSEGPDSLPLYVPPTVYSRDDSAVVSGALANCVSSFADRVSVQPSGVWSVCGGGDTTRPSSTGAASPAGTSAATGCTWSVSGSAAADGATDRHASAHAVAA